MAKKRVTKKTEPSIEDLITEDLLKEDEPEDIHEESDNELSPDEPETLPVYHLQRRKLERVMNSNNPWGRSPKGLEAEKAAMSMLSTKHGIYAQVPIICKGANCPYAFQCELLKYELAPVGEKCPIETARMSKEYSGYAEEFDIDKSSQTDKVLLAEIISLDILLSRCQMLMAKDATPVVDVVAGISDNGEEIVQPAVSKALEAFQLISRRRNDNMQLMMATRRDKRNKTEEQKRSMDILAEVIDDPDFDKVEERPDNIPNADIPT